MKINAITNIQNNFGRNRTNFKNAPAKNNAVIAPNTVNNDKTKERNKKLYYGMGIAAVCIGAGYLITRGKTPSKIKSDGTLLGDLSEYMQTKLSPDALKSVMTKKEFLSEISTLKPENYVASQENIEKGIFCADLHSHTNYSDGKGTVAEILNGVANYADKLYAKAKRKFIFAITDHNGVEGVKQALVLIAKEPDKYKNVRFVTGAEMGFVMKCQQGSAKHNRYHNPTECSEVLAYCFNPFSKNVNEYFKNLHAKKDNAFLGVAKEVQGIYKDVSLSKSEAEAFSDGKNLSSLLNTHWTIFNYAQLKHRAVELSKEQKKPVEHFVNMIKDNKLENPHLFDEYLKAQHIETKTQKIDKNIEQICQKYFPKVENEQIISPTENTFEELVQMFKAEDGTVMGFAHPAFFVENMTQENASRVIGEFIDKSGGMLCLSEKYHQAYDKAFKCNEMTQDFVNYSNDVIDNFHLLSIGGRDNHTSSFLPN